MDKQYFETLPEQMQTLVHEIESAIGAEIVVRARSEGELASLGDPSLGLCICEMIDGITTVEIALPDSRNPTDVLVHEVLHAHRNVVEQVHRMRSAVDDERARRFALRIENDIEHLYIIPVEISFVTNATAYWESQYYRAINEALSESHPMVRRDCLLRNWLVASAVIPHWPGLNQLRSALSANGILRDAQKLVEKIDSVKHDKPLCVSALIRFLKIDRTRYCLEQFLVAEGRTPITEIPRY